MSLKVKSTTSVPIQEFYVMHQQYAYESLDLSTDYSKQSLISAYRMFGSCYWFIEFVIDIGLAYHRAWLFTAEFVRAPPASTFIQ